MTTTAVGISPNAPPVQHVRAAELLDFDEGHLRDNLLRTAGEELSKVSESTRSAMEEQMSVIAHSMSSLDGILASMQLVRTNMRHIETNVDQAMAGAQGSSHELEQVSQRMRVLEEHFKAIHGLIRVVNEIADQTHLLSLNASIEAARAGEAGRGFAVVAGAVKELSQKTKSTNQQIHQTLEQLSEAVATLSTSIEDTVVQTSASVEAVHTTRDNARAICSETERFAVELEKSKQNFGLLGQTASRVDNEIHEINTIGKTLGYLVELVARKGGNQSYNPLARLQPLLEHSQFHAPARFPADAAEYRLQAEDVLISATDTRGKITFANNNFYRVAEYEPGELIGQPHNIVRHPDMPKTAFADLWSIIKKGGLWQGYVANRSKHGRIYWVKATVFPCYERNQIVGYLSLRTQPEALLIQQAIEIYRRLS